MKNNGRLESFITFLLPAAAAKNPSAVVSNFTYFQPAGPEPLF
jgi:hypothetical protein